MNWVGPACCCYEKIHLTRVPLKRVLLHFAELHQYTGWYQEPHQSTMAFGALPVISGFSLAPEPCDLALPFLEEKVVLDLGFYGKLKHLLQKWKDCAAVGQLLEPSYVTLWQPIILVYDLLEVLPKRYPVSKLPIEVQETNLGQLNTESRQSLLFLQPCTVHTRWEMQSTVARETSIWLCRLLAGYRIPSNGQIAPLHLLPKSGCLRHCPPQ